MYVLSHNFFVCKIIKIKKVNIVKKKSVGINSTQYMWDVGSINQSNNSIEVN